MLRLDGWCRGGGVRLAASATAVLELALSALASFDTVGLSGGDGRVSTLSPFSSTGAVVADDDVRSVAPSRAGSIVRLPPNMMLPRLEKEKPLMNASSSRLSLGIETARGANCAGKSAGPDVEGPDDEGRAETSSSEWVGWRRMEEAGDDNEPRIVDGSSISVAASLLAPSDDTSLESGLSSPTERVRFFLISLRGENEGVLREGSGLLVSWVLVVVVVVVLLLLLFD